MAHRKVEEQIEALRLLSDTDPGAAGNALRKALTNRVGLVVAQAAKVVAELRLVELLPDLLRAYDRLFENPVERDPQCWGKNAIARALTALDYRESEPFVRGSRHIQMEPVWGGQASFSVAGMFGSAKVGVDATLTGPGGGTVTGSESDSLTGIGDLYPSFSVKWNRSVHNFMAYTMAGVPVGSYEATRLANLGANHWSLDAGGGYTYLDSTSGREFSATLGFTYNFENPDTDYRNGTSAHLDWAASQFLSEQVHIGLAGYLYGQLTGDSGAGATLGDFKSRVYGAGPQVGYFFGSGKTRWYLNLKGYYEFESNNRPEGWNTWVTLVVPSGGQ